MPSNRGTGSAACGAVDCKRGGVPRVVEDAVGVNSCHWQARHRRVSRPGYTPAYPHLAWSTIVVIGRWAPKVCEGG